MAIKRGKQAKEQGPAIPVELAEMAETAFTAQQLAARWKDLFDSEKADIFKFLETCKEVELSAANKTLKIPGCGAITFKQTTKYEIDKNALADLVTSGRINIHTLIEIASFSDKGLREVLGSSFDDISTPVPGEQLAMTASAEFKAAITKDFEAQLAVEIAKGDSQPKPEPKSKAKPKAKVEPLSLDDSIAAIAAAKEELPVDSDLAAILGE